MEIAMLEDTDRDRECQQLLKEIVALSRLEPQLDPTLLRQHIRNRLRNVVPAFVKNVPEHDRNRIASIALVVLLLAGPRITHTAQSAHGAGPFLAQVCKIARRAYEKHLQHTTPRDRSLDERLDEILLFHETIEKLTDRERKIIYVAFLRGYRIHRIAAALGVPFSAIATHLFRLLAKIRHLVS
jgi:hypothetical protein